MIQIGQKVHSILYGGRDGIIFDIHGEQRPETVQGLRGGVVVMGGNAHLDIVFEDGTISYRLPEAIIHGVHQWTISNEIAAPEEIEAALAFAKETEARKEGERLEKIRINEEAREKIKKEYPFLTRTDQDQKSSSHALGAKNMKRELERAFPGVKFSVKSESYSGGDRISVSWMDGPTSAEVKEISHKYQECYFDGMQDIEEYRDTVWPGVFGGAKYVFENRHHSETVFRMIVEKVCGERGVSLPEIKTGYRRQWIEDYTKPNGSARDLRSLVDIALSEASFYTPPEKTER